MIAKTTLHKAAKVVARRDGETDELAESCTAYADRLVDEGRVVHVFVHGGESEWRVVDETDWWAIVGGRHVKAGPYDTKADVVAALHAETTSRVRSPRPGGGWIDGLYKVDGRADTFAVRHDVAREKGWV